MSDETDFWVRFWGVRGSIACAGPDTIRYGGNTSCLEVRCGARLLGQALPAEPLEFDHFFSHTHFDHVAGLPFFLPFYRKGGKIRIRAGHLSPPHTMESTLRLAMSAPLFPVPFDVFQADIDFIDFTAGDTLDLGDGIEVRTAVLNHPNGATGYRVSFGGKSICYVTDTEHTPGEPDRNILDLIEGADIVVYDATYNDAEFPTYVGWGHSTWQEGVRLAEAANVGQLVIFHHEPGRDDDALDDVAREAKAAFAGATVAREGDTLRP